MSPVLRSACAALLAPLMACTAIHTTTLVRTGPARVVSEEPARVARKRLRADAHWMPASAGKEASFSFAAVEEAECESAQVTERSQTLVTVRSPEKPLLLALSYAVGLTGAALFAWGAYRHWHDGEPMEKPAPTHDDPKNKSLTTAGNLLIAGGAMSIALVPSLYVTFGSIDTKVDREPNIERSYHSVPCAEPAARAERHVELTYADRRYSFRTDLDGKAELSAQVLRAGAVPIRGAAAMNGKEVGLVYIDGFRQPDLVDLPRILAEGLDAEPAPRSAAELLQERCDGGDCSLHDAWRCLCPGRGRSGRRTALCRSVSARMRGRDVAGCYELGRALQQGRGVAAQPRQAVEPLDFACQNEIGGACSLLGYLLQHSDAGAQSPQRAASLYQRACTFHDATGCYNLARQYAQGRGVAKNLPKAAALYAEACEMGVSPSCHNLALFYAQGLGVGRDPKRAEVLYQRACTGGYTPSCHPAEAHGNGADLAAP